MSIGMLLDMAVAAHPDRVAIGRTGAADPAAAPGTRLTYADLARHAAGAATVVREARARHIVHVGLNGPVFPVLIFAGAMAGVPVTPLNYRLQADRLAELLAELPDPLVVADDAYADTLSGALPAGSRGTIVRPADLLARAAAAEPAVPADVADDAPAVVLFTSGTTSRPKGVVLRHENLVGYVLTTVDLGQADASDAVLVSVPPYHVAGVGSVLSNVYAGRRMVHLPDFEPARWLRVAREEAVTQAMVVPTMLARITAHLDGTTADVPSLRAMAYGGARMPANVLAQALAAFPDTGFTNAYGLTETSSTIAVLGPEDHRAALESGDPAVRARLASAGRLVPGVEGVVRDSDGKDLGPGETGELWVRGPQVSGEYLGLGSVLDAEGWFPTRDRARFDADGYLFVEGRADDTIIRGGENIAPAEIEDVLVHHPHVREVAVIGLPDDEWGQRIAAVVVPEAGCEPDSDDIRAWVRERLRGQRTPDEVIVREELPYTPTGKLLRRELVAELGG